MTYYVFTLVFFLFDYFILAMGLNIQYGETGILNFAYIGFVAIGAYFTGVFSLHSAAGTGQFYILGLGLPFPINLLLGGIAAMCFALVVALITLRRLRTDYLAIVLISLSLVLYDFCNNYVGLFNGADGLYNVPEPFAKTLGLTVNSFIPFFACLTAVISLLMWFVMSRVTRAPMGRTFRAIRDDHVVAAALGKNVFGMQLKSMLIGSFYAGIGGGLLIQFGGSFNPTAWLPGETFVVFAVLLVGGAGNNIGMFVGALLVETLLVHSAGVPAGDPRASRSDRVLRPGARRDRADADALVPSRRASCLSALRRTASFGVVDRGDRETAGTAAATQAALELGDAT